MNGSQLGRRDFLQIGLLGGLSLITGCTSIKQGPLLMASPETLPKHLRRNLPTPWRFEPLQFPLSSTPYEPAMVERADLISLSDGWLTDFPCEKLQPIDNPELKDRLAYQAKTFLRSLPPFMDELFLPIGVSPWVMLFRNGAPWFQEANNSWDVLLDSALKGEIVFPQSPRLLISISETIAQSSALRRLREQALTFDDRNALNWLLEGKARLAILPLQRCLSILRRDQRLSISMPRSGSPLNWTLLARPSSTSEPLPKRWVEGAWSMPLLAKLLASGWLPAISREELTSGLSVISSAYRSVALPSESVWKKCWSLPPLTKKAQTELLQQWKQSTP